MTETAFCIRTGRDCTLRTTDDSGKELPEGVLCCSGCGELVDRRTREGKIG